MKNFFMLLLATLFSVSCSIVHSKENENDAKMLKEAKISLTESIKIAQKSISGDVIRAELEDDDGKLIWDIEVVSSMDKKVYDLEIDAKSGKILKSKLDEEDNEKEKDDEEDDD